MFIVVDISKTKEKLVTELQYWDSFLSNQCRQVLGILLKPQVIVIGSHWDVVRIQGEETLSQALRELPQLSTSITLDCTLKSSSGLTEICNHISNHSTRNYEQFSVTAQVHFLNRLLQEEFKDKIACQLHEIMESVAKMDNIMLRKNDLLTSDPNKLSEQLLKISQHGQILYFENSNDTAQSWVIFKKEVLLSEVNGLIFAPKKLEPDYRNFDSTGVVALSKVSALFPKHDINMLMSFMTYLDFCQQLKEVDISAMGVNHDELHYLKQETYYFFPALVNSKYPAENCKTILGKNYKCGWCLCCKEAIFFTSRFLHVMLLRLAFTFALPAASSPIQENSLTAERRQCNIWKNGIHWLNMDGVETIVQVVEQNTAVVLLMGCLTGSEIKCIQLRSAVIQTILATKEKYSIAIDAEESFIQKPEKAIAHSSIEVRSLYTFPLSSLKMAIKQRKEFLTNKIGSSPDSVNINVLLYFEPYTCLSKEIINKLLEESNQDLEVSDDFLRECAKVAYPKMAFLKDMLLLPEHNSEYSIAIKEYSDQYSDNSTHECFHIFKTWHKFTPNPTYRGLREALDRFSIFRGRYPLP